MKRTVEFRRSLDAYYTEAEPLLPNRRRQGKDHIADCPCCGHPFVYERVEKYIDVLSRECQCEPDQILTALEKIERARKAKDNGHEALTQSQSEKVERTPFPKGETLPSSFSNSDKDQKDPFPFLSFNDLCDLPPPIYQIEDFFLEQSLVQIFGETNHGKSLLLWDLACSICLGAETWFGRRINLHGPVVWINADGGRGLTLRAKAWREANGAEMEHPLFTLMGSVHLNKADQVGKFRLKLLAMNPRPVLVIFDTQSRCMPGGRENDQDEMTLVTEGLHRIKTEVGCTVVPIHHSNVQGDRERGSGIVKNEADTQIRVSKDKESGIFTVKCVKGRDHPEFRDFFFKVKPVLDSIVILEHDSPPPKNPHDEKMDRQQEFLQLVIDNDGITFEELSDEMQLSDKSVRVYADELIEKKVISKKKLPKVEGSPGRRKFGLFANPATTDPRIQEDE